MQLLERAFLTGEDEREESYRHSSLTHIFFNEPDNFNKATFNEEAISFLIVLVQPSKEMSVSSVKLHLAMIRIQGMYRGR
ncbi:hypothetical protein GCK32_001286 [Trichostrongylus colubriformis]|uniref:Uncharacterized protein n=1 Tax=Trichostrongylus colubriformis TaxID=6319 RepID=A0AAN8IUW3_TRICO